MRLFFILLTLILITGCKECPSPQKCEKTKIIKTKCPKFTSKLSIDVLELNSTHAAISWTDVSRIEFFLKEKKKFNSIVDKL
jgi:hypothetical protein